MKKRYITPEMETLSMHLTTMIAGSNAITTKGLGGGNSMKYGGVDEDGELDPSARRMSNWDDEEDEDY